MGKNRKLFALLLFFLSSTIHAEKIYRFGVVPQFEPRHLATIWMPILDELASRTGLKFVLSGSPHIPEFEHDFQQGQFDFAYMNPYHSLMAFNTQGYWPLVRDGGRSLFGILVVPKTSPIRSIEALQNQTVLFPAPNALGASLLMRAELAELHHIKVKPHYVATHSSVYTNLLLGRAAAGGGVMGTLKRQKPQIQENLRIIYQTRRIAPHPVVVHPRVLAADREAVKKAFLAMGETSAGRALLDKIPIKKIIAATVKDYRPLQAWGLEKYVVDAP